MTTQLMIEDIVARLPLLPPNIVQAIYEIAITMPPEIESKALAEEDAIWDNITTKYADKLSKLSEKIASEPSLPMFDENGRWLLDDYTEADFAPKTNSGT